MYLLQTLKLEILFLLLMTILRNVNVDAKISVNCRAIKIPVYICVVSIISMAAQSEMWFILWYCTPIYFIDNNF